MPAFVVFQMPPAAPARKKVRDGLGIPATLDTRPPMLAGPMLRQRNPADRVESSRREVWAATGGVNAAAMQVSAAHKRWVIDGLEREVNAEMLQHFGYARQYRSVEPDPAAGRASQGGARAPRMIA